MKLSIMQPYLFPYIGYFQLFAASDIFVHFDNVQFIDKGWINRNRLLHPSIKKKWQYITYPLANKSNNQPIYNITIDSKFDFFKNLYGKLSAFKKAPYYKELLLILAEIESLTRDETHISNFNFLILNYFNNLFNLNCEIIKVCDIDFDYSSINDPGDWALMISNALGAETYINPINGRDIFNKELFKKLSINLKFLSTEFVTYSQYRGYFEPGLSIIDVLLWNGKQQTQDLIFNSYNLED